MLLDLRLFEFLKIDFRRNYWDWYAKGRGLNLDRKEWSLFLKLQKPDSGEGITLLPVNLKVPSKDIVDTLREDVRYHTIKKDVPYRLWNLVSNGLIQPMPDKPTVVTCSGNFGDANSKEMNYKTLISFIRAE